MTCPTTEVRHCVIIPSYNSGPLLEETVRQVLNFWQSVIVVVDGSTDGSAQAVLKMTRDQPGLQLVEQPNNTGKGGAVLAGLVLAADQDFTHAAVFDADGQHQASDLPRFIEASRTHPEALILGDPTFGPDAPKLRVHGRRIGNWWANLETWWGGINDSLFGFRIYPIGPALKILQGMDGGRRFDVDTQLAVRLYWSGAPPLNLPTPVHYHPKEGGGVSHFKYLRDNLLLIRTHAGLLLRAVLLIPRLLAYRRRQPLDIRSCPPDSGAN